MVSNHGKIPLDRGHNLCYTEGEQKTQERRAVVGLPKAIVKGGDLRSPRRFQHSVPGHKASVRGD